MLFRSHTLLLLYHSVYKQLILRIQMQNIVHLIGSSSTICAYRDDTQLYMKVFATDGKSPSDELLRMDQLPVIMR